ncbi:hypothetical protein ACIGBJ_24560, partial [Stutzerimonas stutzeri]|uniref:hypothetical protein n=1 Tax=Stutzerimonas stutzeri TaxID=316 RepID=UPI0037CF54C5
RSVGDDQRCQSADRDRRAPNTGLQRFYTLWAGSYRCETRLSASSSRSIVSIEPLAIQLPNQNFQARPAEIVLGLRKQHIPQTKLDFLFISLHPPWQIMR